MARVALSSACNSILSQNSASVNRNTHFGDASFSSYLNSAKEKTIRELTESTWDLSPTITIPQEPLCPISLGKQKTQDSEISIFGAEKYFNGGMDEEMPRIAEEERNPLHKKDEQVDLHCTKPKIKPGTPSASSETSWNSQSTFLPRFLRNPSLTKQNKKKDEQVDLHCTKPKIKPGTPSASSETSWSSQSAFLPRFLRNPSLTKQNKVYGKRFFTSFGCNCYCSDKKSVDIDETVGENNHKNNIGCGGVHSKEITNDPIKIGRDPLGFIKQSQSESWVKEEMHCQKFGKVGSVLNREECFTFPILNSELGNITVKRQFEEKDEEEKARKSLEVFGSSVLEKGGMALKLERRLAMLNWDATPRVGITATSGSGGVHEDDIESDASSDLFEIGSFSSNPRPSLTRQPSHGMSSSMTPATCYEPIDASIECATNISAASAYKESRPVAIVTKPEGIILTTTAKTTAKTVIGKEFQIRRTILPLGCKSRKAVKVAGEAYMMNEKPKSDLQMHQRLDSFKMARFQAESKVMDFEMAHAQRAFALHSLSRSNSARQS